MIADATRTSPTEQPVTTNVAILQSQPYVAATAQGWHRRAYDDVYQRLANERDFPCVFSRNAIRKGLLKFIFVEGCALKDMRRLAKGMMSFVEISTDWNGDLNTAYPLVVAFSQEATAAAALEEFHAFGWQILQRLHSLDTHPWPEDISYDPNSSNWSMCFGGMPIFCNMSHPAHRNRASRNLGDHFKFIINPRERFDKVAGDTPAGRKARANIRDRILAYDGQPHSPQLGCYGEESLEWWQYALSDQNVSVPYERRMATFARLILMSLPQVQRSGLGVPETLDGLAHHLATLSPIWAGQRDSVEQLFGVFCRNLSLFETWRPSPLGLPMHFLEAESGRRALTSGWAAQGCPFQEVTPIGCDHFDVFKPIHLERTREWVRRLVTAARQNETRQEILGELEA